MSECEGNSVLCVGLVCVDIISVCHNYPQEDTDQRSLDYYWQRGGNASNSASVLSLLGSKVEFMGTLVKGQEIGFLKSDFHKYEVCIENCVIHPEGRYRCPVAIVILNKENGSRTIMAALKSAPFQFWPNSASVEIRNDRNTHLAEIEYEDFNRKIELHKYKWIHFEGRPNLENMLGMIQKISDYNCDTDDCSRIKVSLELEKIKRQELKVLMNQVDVVFVSKEYAMFLGYTCKEDAVEGLVSQCKPTGIVICAWGEDGAAAKSLACDIVTSPIFQPEAVVDTLGAGDTFNAASIHALSNGKGLQAAITFGCKVAGRKCGMTGNSGLKRLNKLL